MNEVDQNYEQEAARIEKIIGRKPTLREVERNDLDRPDTRSVRDKVFAAARKVPMAAPADRLVAQLQEQRAELQEQVEWNQYVKSSPAERRVKDFERMIDVRNDAQEVLKAQREHSQTMASELAPLRELRERMRWNDQYSIQQVEEVEFAIRIGETVGHDPTAFKKLRGNVLGAEDARIEQAKFERSARITALQNEIAELERGKFTLTMLEPKQRIRVSGPDVQTRLEMLIDGMSFKYGHTDEDFEEAFRARRALVLQGEFALAEAVLAKYADTIQPTNNYEESNNVENLSK
jgi:hypothetical protein